MEGTSDRSFTLNIPKARPNQQQLAGGSPPKPSYGRTPLHVAVMSGDIVSARLLLDNGATPSTKPTFSGTRLCTSPCIPAGTR